MSREHMVKCLELLRGDDCERFMPTIGGGEPTLHPLCLEFVRWVVQECENASASCGCSVVGIVTNGSREKHAIELARMARQGEISARLSYDSYHDLSKVSKRVWKAFQKKYDDEIWQDEEGYYEEASENDGRAMNQPDYFITPHGRALKNGMYNHPFYKKDSCCCNGVFITPDGTIWQCGCRKVKMGHLNNLDLFWKTYYANIDENGEMPCSKKHVLQVPLDDFKLES